MSISPLATPSAGGKSTEPSNEKAPPSPKRTVGTLGLPRLVHRNRYVWPYIFGIGSYHVIALLAFVPWFFSWSGLVLAICGIYVFGMLGINLCYHRVLTHQGMVLPKWLEHTFAIFGLCCLQDTPARWVAIHRLHHQHSDEQDDPHSPLVSFTWGHVGWLFLRNDCIDDIKTYERYARDILRDPLYLSFERNLAFLWINLLQSVLYFGIGTGIGLLITPTVATALQFGTSIWLWGVVVRTVLVLHITWSVNSLTHIWGYQNYSTDDNSRNNWLVAVVSNGEGWHNNHHAFQRSAVHGHKWWEFDLTWQTIRLLEILGLAKNVVRHH